jgi:hypothetical protein
LEQKELEPLFQLCSDLERLKEAKLALLIPKVPSELTSSSWYTFNISRDGLFIWRLKTIANQRDFLRLDA